MTPAQAGSTKPGRDTGGKRRRLLLWSAVPMLLVLCVAGKLLSLGLLAVQAAGAYAAGDAAGVETAAAGLGLANLVEPHKAPSAAGDAQVLGGNYAAARPLFEDALDAAPQGTADACIIRINLSLAIERTGDARLRTGDPASAVALYREALAVAEAAPAGCFAGAAGEAGEQLTEAEVRLNKSSLPGRVLRRKKHSRRTSGRSRIPRSKASWSSLRTAPGRHSANATPDANARITPGH